MNDLAPAAIAAVNPAALRLEQSVTALERSHRPTVEAG
jgi:hypothetical protein